MGWMIQGSIASSGRRCFLLQTSRSALAFTHPPAQWAPVTFLLGLKLQKYEFNHSPPSSTEVKNEWSYITVTPIRLHGMDSENCTFTFTEKVTI